MNIPAKWPPSLPPTGNSPYQGSTSLEVMAAVLQDGLTIVPLRANSDGSLVSGEPPVGSYFSGTAAIATTGVSVGLAANPVKSQVTIAAKKANTADIMVGAFALSAGQSVTLAVPNTNLIFINGTAADAVTFIGS